MRGGCISSLMPFFFSCFMHICFFESVAPDGETTIEIILSLFEFRIF